MSKNKAEKSVLKRMQKLQRRKKKNALVICRNGKEFWTTQDQFWQWVRDRIVVKSGDSPLRGEFIRANEEYAVVINNTVLNLAHRNHLREVIESRRFKS